MTKSCQIVRIKTLKKLGGCQAQNLGANDVEGRAQDGRHQHDQQEIFLRHKIAKQPLERPAKILRFLYWPTHRAPTASAHRSAALHAARVWSPLLLTHAILSAISATESWEDTISR